MDWKASCLGKDRRRTRRRETKDEIYRVGGGAGTDATRPIEVAFHGRLRRRDVALRQGKGTKI